MACLVGCDDKLPSTEKVAATASAVGKAAAYATSIAVDKNTLDNIVVIVGKVQAVVPSTNDTCVSAWTPVVEAEVTKLVEAGKLTDEKAILVKTASLLAAEGVDYLFKMNPTWKNYTDISNVAVKSLCEGFTSVLEKKATMSAPYGMDADNYDKAAYEYFLKKAKSK
jgi:hypothetical protein